MTGSLHLDDRLGLPAPEPVDVYLWMLVLTGMSLDIGLTVYGLEHGLIEQNPIAVFGMAIFGYAVLAFLKVPALLLGLVGWAVLSVEWRRLNLVGLALPWILAILTNSWLLLTAT